MNYFFRKNLINKKKIIVIAIITLFQAHIVDSKEIFLAPRSKTKEISKKVRWKNHYSFKGNYRQSNVEKQLLKKLKTLESNGEIGNNILELGSNHTPLSWKLPNIRPDQSVTCIDILFDDPEIIETPMKTLQIHGD